jgi:hypothetical protein
MQLNEINAVGLSPDQWFGYAGQLAMFGWLILVLLPRRFKWLFFIPQYLIPLLLGLLYAGLALTTYFTSDGGYNSLAGVRMLFEDDRMLLAGWVHYLAFDLFIGSWIAKKSDALGISRLLQAPVLIATFMFGPVGLVMFFCMRASFLRTLKIDQQPKELANV